MSAAPTAAEIAADARWLAQALDPAARLVRLVEMDRAAYRAAAFLDDRLLQAPMNAHIVPWASVASAVTPGMRRDARWIFHIGHVGSTLLSRLLGELDGVLALREPRLLRDLAMLPGEGRAEYVPAVQALLSRTFAPDETALVKATSFASEIAAELVPEGGRALFMFARPRAYLGTILAGENSLIELATLDASRSARMAARVPAPPGGSRPAFQAARAWACEMTALEAAAEFLGEVQWIDFDAMLADVAGTLDDVARFLGFDPGRVEAAASGPLLKRYSKALEYEYSPALRQQLIEQAIAEHPADVDMALALLKSAAQDSPLLARALERSDAER